MHHLATYWPAQHGWTIPCLDWHGTEIVVEVSRYMGPAECLDVTINATLRNGFGSVPGVFERTVSLG
jgi:hypothetical protein